MTTTADPTEPKVKVTADGIRVAIAHVEQVAASGDYERAHCLKDALKDAVLQEIAEYETGDFTPTTAYRMRGLARAALKVTEIDCGWAG